MLGFVMGDETIFVLVPQSPRKQQSQIFTIHAIARLLPNLAALARRSFEPSGNVDQF